VRGQASTDYVAVLVVVIVLVLAAAAAADGSAIGGTVRRQVLRALCVVGRGDCDQDRRPCVTRSRRVEDATGVTLVVLRLEGRRAVLREERSDGTIAITQTELDSAGVRLLFGGGGHVAAGGVAVGLGGELSATYLGSLGRGRTWVVRDRAAADALVARLRGSGSRALPMPDATFDSGDFRTAGGGALRRLDLAGTLSVSAEDAKGERVERATGRRTVYLERTQDGSAGVTLAGAGAGVGAGAAERYAVTFDRAGRPVDLVVTATGSYSASIELPRRLQSAAGLLGSPTTGRRQWSEETHLDLTDPVSLALAREFLGQVTGGSVVHAGRRVAVTRALADRLDAVGVVHARTYESQQSTRGVGGRIGAGLGVGADLDETTTTTRLVSASTRGLDGVWRMRMDCLAAA
jgi:hypothetical protein